MTDPTTLTWARRPTPLPAAAVAVRVDAVPNLLSALAGRVRDGADLRLVIGPAAAVVLGDEPELPWCEGAHYLGWEAGVLVATHSTPQPAVDLLVPSLRASVPEGCDLVALLPWGILAARTPTRPIDPAGLAHLHRDRQAGR